MARECQVDIRPTTGVRPIALPIALHLRRQRLNSFRAKRMISNVVALRRSVRFRVEPFRGWRRNQVAGGGVATRRIRTSAGTLHIMGEPPSNPTGDALSLTRVHTNAEIGSSWRPTGTASRTFGKDRTRSAGD
jgi:hypothetical protein